MERTGCLQPIDVWSSQYGGIAGHITVIGYVSDTGPAFIFADYQ